MEGRVGVGGSSPDLVSRRTLGHAAVRQVQGGVTVPDIHTMVTNPDIHRTYDNLANYDSTGDTVETYRHRAYSTEVRIVIFIY